MGLSEVFFVGGEVVGEDVEEAGEELLQQVAVAADGAVFGG